jgi:hypothetical protein
MGNDQSGKGIKALSLSFINVVIKDFYTASCKKVSRIFLSQTELLL